MKAVRYSGGGNLVILAVILSSLALMTSAVAQNDLS
jgi:hypothetical protein